MIPAYSLLYSSSSSSWMIQATVDAKRKEIELLKLQTALVLVGDGVHREILDHFAPWIAWCYRRAPLIPCSSRDFLIYYTHTHPMTLFVADHRPIISSEQGALLLCLMCVRCTLRRPHLASMQRRPFYISIIYCSPSTTFCCNTARTWDDDEYQPDTAAAAAGAFLSFFSFHPPFFFFFKELFTFKVNKVMQLFDGSL